MRTIQDVDVSAKRVLLRVDFNVPLAQGTVTDDTRIRAALPTIQLLLNKQARLILISHLGRPSGNGHQSEFSLAPAARVLGRLLGKEVPLAALDSSASRELAAGLANQELMMLENLRFDPREKQNSQEMARELAQLADIYVNDAFGTAHRAHTSTVALARQLPAYAGLLLAREVETLQAMMARPARPFVAVLGGGKVDDKIAVIRALLSIVDSLIIGGAMCFTFLAAQGANIGRSRFEPDALATARELLALAQEKGVEFLLPLDLVVAREPTADASGRILAVDEMQDDMMGLDIGPASAERFAQALAQAATIFWNGPMGVFELPPFAAGTQRIIQAIAANRRALTIAGGGDSVAAVRSFGDPASFSFVSTGGGAALQLIEGSELPGIAALE